MASSWLTSFHRDEKIVERQKSTRSSRPTQAASRVCLRAPPFFFQGGSDVVPLPGGRASSPPQASLRVLLELPPLERAGADRRQRLGLHGAAQGHAAENPAQYVAHHPDDLRRRSFLLGCCHNCRPSWETDTKRQVSGIPLLAESSTCLFVWHSFKPPPGKQEEDGKEEILAMNGYGCDGILVSVQTDCCVFLFPYTQCYTACPTRNVETIFF